MRMAPAATTSPSPSPKPLTESNLLPEPASSSPSPSSSPAPLKPQHHFPLHQHHHHHHHHNMKGKKASPPSKREIVEVNVEDLEPTGDVTARNDDADFSTSENELAQAPSVAPVGPAKARILRHLQPMGGSQAAASGNSHHNGNNSINNIINNSSNNSNGHHHHHNLHQKRRLGGSKRPSSTPSPNPLTVASSSTPSPSPLTLATSSSAATLKPAATPALPLGQDHQRLSPPASAPLRSQMRLDLQKEQLRQEEERLLQNSLREQSFRVQHEYESLKRFSSPLEESRRRLMNLARLSAEQGAKSA